MNRRAKYPDKKSFISIIFNTDRHTETHTASTAWPGPPKLRIHDAAGCTTGCTSGCIV